MFKLLNNNKLLNLDWLGNVKVKDNKLQYELTNGVTYEEEHETPEQALSKLEEVKTELENIKDGGSSEPSYEDTLTPEEYTQCLTLTKNILGIKEPIEQGTYLFKDGVFKDITSMEYVSLQGAETGVLTIDNTINCIQTGSGNMGSEYKLVSDKQIDFTNVNKLIINFTTNTHVESRFNIAIPEEHSSIESYKDNVPDIVYTCTELQYSGTLELDVSSYIGYRYILFRMGSGIFNYKRTLNVISIQII